MEKIKNFSIIAHVDHGKSTLADRILEITGAISKREMKEQFLDRMDLERERGITIKMQPVSVKYKGYTLNLIDTPGHIDFSYEVSRSLRAVEGVILLIDSTQGIQAQTVSVLSMAKDLNLKIIPVLSKTDMPNSRPKEVTDEVIELLDVSEADVIHTSGKTGSGVEELLDRIISDIPEPKEIGNKKKALVFDFSYTTHNGITAYARVFNGPFKKGDSLTFLSIGKKFNLKNVGIFTPEEKSMDSVNSGMICFFTTGIKETGIALVGDTISADEDTEAFSGYKEISPVIWASLFPQDGDDFVTLAKVLKELKISDASLTFEEERSDILGKGFRCGFLGMLHLEIITERMRREFGLELIITSPSTDFKVYTKKGDVVYISNPASFPDHGDILKIEEPWVSVDVITSTEYLQDVVQLINEYEGLILRVEDFKAGRNIIRAEMPLREFMRRFFDSLKSVSSGYASMSYKRIEEREADVVKMDVFLAGKNFPAFARVVSRQKGEREARLLVENLYENLPRAMFTIKIQAMLNGRIVASKTLPALRKDVTAKLYGGDVTRKMKLKEKQKKGKQKMQSQGKVRVPHEVFLKIVKGEK